MDKFSKKRVLQDLAVNKENQQNQIQQLQKTVMGVFQKMFQIEQRTNSSSRIENVLDFRTRAVVEILKEKLGITDEQIKNKIFDLQVEQFTTESAADDVERNLEEADGAVENGMFAISTIKVFKDGVEVEQQRVVRSKVEVGKAEFLPEIDSALVGMKVGETKTIDLNLQGQTDKAEITVLGLRKHKVEAPKAEEKAEEPTQETTEA
jgi:FKBP-type peptidyl-prolyl cis-trans isomerase (trigger factor)